MRIIETKDIPIDNIVKNPFQSRLDKEKLEENGLDKQKIKKHEETKKEKIEGMAISFEKSGLLNSVIVREKDGKYQIIAGDLRIQAFKLNGQTEISAKIVEASDLEVRIIGFVENYHRQDLMDVEKEEAIYSIWRDGQDEIFHNNKTEMSRWTGIQYDKLLLILTAAEERRKEKNKPEKEQSKAIINATAKDLKITRPLDKINSDARKELLKAKNERKLSLLDLERSVKAIKDASENNTSKEVLTGIVKLISDKKLVPKNADDFVKTIIQIPKEEQKELVDTIKLQEKVDIYELRPVTNAIKEADDNVSKDVLTGVISLYSEKKLSAQNAEDFIKIIKQIPKEEQKGLVNTIKRQEKVDIGKVKNFVSVYMEAPSDIQKKMIDNKIDIEEAKVVSKFRSKGSREQIIQERKIIVEMKDKEKDKELKEHTKIREEQEKAVESFGDRKPGQLTNMDIDNGVKGHYNSPEQVDKRVIDRYRDIMYKNELYKSSTFKNIHLDKTRKAIIEMVWHIYEHWYSYLVEIGEIKIIGDVDNKNVPPPKKLYA